MHAAIDGAVSGGRRTGLPAAIAIACCGFIALGIWQLHRLQWKLDLIARVDARVHTDPVPAPARSTWPRISAAGDEYRHVRLTGRYLANCQTRVQALTALGAGFWVLSPFELRDGGVVLINRGYIPRDHTVPPAPQGVREVSGLLRLSEPGGGFLRRNDPAGNRWYSRDVGAIAATCRLQRAAPFFVDADAGATAWPRAGLTVTHFPNNHLSYALTWFALAAMSAWAAWRLLREERAARRRQPR